MNRTISVKELKKFLEDRMKGIDRDFPEVITTLAPQPVPSGDESYSRKIIFIMWIVISAIYLAIYYLVYLWAKGRNARKRAEAEARIEAIIRSEQERILSLPEIRPIMRQQSRRRQRRSSSRARVRFDAKVAGEQPPSRPVSGSATPPPADEASANVTIALVHSPQHPTDDASDEGQLPDDREKHTNERDVDLQIREY